MNLSTLGWNEFFHDNFINSDKKNFQVARVAIQYNEKYLLYSEAGELQGELSGKLRHSSLLEEESFPVVGDWVITQVLQEEAKAIIHGVLPRKTKFSRKAPGGKLEQLIAANIDTAFLVMGLDHDFNLRRLERYLLLAWQSGSNALVILNKSDLCENIAETIAEVEKVTMGVPIIVTNAINNAGLEDMRSYIKTGETIVLLGSSGVGKSTLVNYLMGYEVQKTQAVREGDSKGRHTTTNRELHFLPEGGLVIDTPGMRELSLWETEDAWGKTFGDIQDLALECHFRDCQHQGEPGCAVQDAIDQGNLEPKRLDNYNKLQREQEYLEIKKDQAKQSIQKKKWKKIHKQMRKHPKRY